MYYLIHNPGNHKYRIVSDTHIGSWSDTITTAISSFFNSPSLRVFSTLAEYLVYPHIPLLSLNILETDIINQYPEFFI